MEAGSHKDNMGEGGTDGHSSVVEYKPGQVPTPKASEQTYTELVLVLDKVASGLFGTGWFLIARCHIASINTHFSQKTLF